MTTTLERPATTERITPPVQPEPPRGSRRNLGFLILVLAIVAGGIAVAISVSGGSDGLTKGQTAYGQRLEQLAENYVPPVVPVLTPGQSADALRWTERAREFGALPTRGQQAEAARWEARAAAELGLTRSQQATADRYQGFADELTRGRRAETERWQAIADSYK